jgi:hypothetical protein
MVLMPLWCGVFGGGAVVAMETVSWRWWVGVWCCSEIIVCVCVLSD